MRGQQKRCAGTFAAHDLPCYDLIRQRIKEALHAHHKGDL